MLKTLTLTVYLWIVLVLSGMFGDVVVTPNIPNEVKAGGEFTVTYTINKGNINSFARYQLDLPNGFTVKEKESQGGRFIFEDGSIKIQWWPLPYDEEFSISFTVQVPPTVVGEFELMGTFKYLKDNEIETLKLPVHNLRVIGSESVDDLTATNTYNYQGVRIKQVDCIRQKPYLNNNNEIVVNLLVVNKALLNDFAKIQEQVPRGYKAVALKSKNAIFTSNGRFIKFMWMQMPAEEYFTVSYKLIQTEDIPNQAFIISGEFSFFRNERTDVIDIAERNIDLTQFVGDELVVDNSPVNEDEDKVDLLDAGDQFTGTEVTLETETYVPPETTANDQQGLASNDESQEQADEDITRNEQVQGSVQGSGTISASRIRAIQQGISYRVQIAAGHKLVDYNYFRKRNIQDNIQTEIHQGWHKYTVGSFNIYKSARDHRNSIWDNTSITDAFVCAYTDGQRITVQEALMIANQKWYK